MWQKIPIEDNSSSDMLPGGTAMMGAWTGMNGSSCRSVLTVMSPLPPACQYRSLYNESAMAMTYFKLQTAILIQWDDPDRWRCEGSDSESFWFIWDSIFQLLTSNIFTSVTSTSRHMETTHLGHMPDFHWVTNRSGTISNWTSHGSPLSKIWHHRRLQLAYRKLILQQTEPC